MMNSSSGISTFSGVCIVVNMLMGSGFLALPYAFYRGGILANIVSLFIIVVVMVMTCTWEGKCVIKCGRLLRSYKVPEVTEAVRIYCGSRMRNLYVSILALSLGSCSWVYAILFAQTMSSVMPQTYHPEISCMHGDINNSCHTRYVVNIIILGIITTPLALMDLKEQTWIQNSLAILRIIRILIMAITPMLATTSEQVLTSFQSTFENSEVIYPTPLVAGDFSGLCVALSTAVFSLFLNANIPIVLDALSNKSNLVKVLVRGFTICTLLYVWLGISVSTRFQSEVDNPCNLNWDGYRWPYSGSCTNGSFCDLSARFVELLIVFCPVLDVVSIYPICSIVLGNSLWEVAERCYHSSIHGESNKDGYNALNTEMTQINNSKKETSLLNIDIPHYGGVETDKDIEHGASTPSVTFCSSLPQRILRSVVNIIPLVLAVAVPNFLSVVQYAGAISVVICLVFPAYMSIKCDEYEDRYTVPSVLPSDPNHLEWCDDPQSTSSDPKQLSPFRGGLGIRRRDSFWTNDTSWTETTIAKKITLYFGIFVTCVIFASSVYYS
jgi:amino acid permease